MYAIFLREKGPGIHHVMFSTPDYQSCAERMARHQISVMAGGELQQTQFQMFDTRETLGLICEIADGGALVPD